jgi:SAM-dependent methyltransferase
MKKTILGFLGVVVFLGLSLPGGQQSEWDYSFQWDVPYVPTPVEVVDRMLEMANVGPSDILYDLGCGDGRIVIQAASRFGTRGVGIDIDPERIEECKVNAAKANVEDLVTFLNQDLFRTDIRQASVVTLYLLRSVNLRLRPKLFKELKPGTRVVSHDFSMDDWTADQKEEVLVNERKHSIFFWVIPANISGKWKFVFPQDLNEFPNALEIGQKFQTFEGKVYLGTSVLPVKDTRLQGDRIAFSIEQKGQNGMKTWQFEGQANGDAMEGTLRLDSGERLTTVKWKARRDPSTRKQLDSGERVD